MQRTEILEKSIKNAKKYKDYKFPSGRAEKIQGYENFALDYLIKNHKEEDIIVGNKNIVKYVGKIIYNEKKDDKEKRYFPDIYIISENKIIEVKSEWTYKKHLNKNICKKNRCEELGFKFEFMIFNRKGNEIKE